ncbi:MAG: hypothetical protein PHW69_07215 [Elusimicrobiaceae bacterium]|nr:hypothetical protein [Elusimicrobiaceae bacterium]
MTDNKGFTRFELGFVIAATVLFGLLVFKQYAAASGRSRAASCLSMRTAVALAADRYAVVHDNLFISSFAGLVRAGYLDRVPACPSGGEYVWLSTGVPSRLICSLHGAQDYAPGADPENDLFVSGCDNLSGFKVSRGKWQPQSGKLTAPDGGLNVAFFGSERWRDYTLTVIASHVAGRGPGICYRCADGGALSGYLLEYGENGRELAVSRMADGTKTRVASGLLPRNFRAAGAPHIYSVTVTGDSHVVKADDAPVFAFTDTAFQSGAAGLFAEGGAGLAIDSVRVSK